MLAPGAKGWINKYFELVDSGDIVLSVTRPEELRKLHFMHLTMSTSGIIFGHPSSLIFAKNIPDKDWTREEKLKLLLFESHLFVYIQTNIDEPFKKENFLNDLIDFYAHHSHRSIKKLFTFFLKEGREEKLERILTKRLEIKAKIENKWWVNSLNNAFAYLDVVLFDDFVHKEQDLALRSYSFYAKNALIAVVLAAYSDGVMEEKEKVIFDVFLASANLPEEERDRMKEMFKKGAELSDIHPIVKERWLLKRFILDIAILTAVSNKEIFEGEYHFLETLCKHLDLPHEDLGENLTIVENFLVEAYDTLVYINEDSSYKKVYSSVSNRWRKVLLRNKDKLTTELRESKELIALVKKSATTELTAEEKDLVKTQFKDLARSIPALAIFMLPGGTILLPLLLKIIPELVPTAFRENTLNEEEDKHE